jgi:hypothetical protein
VSEKGRRDAEASRQKLEPLVSLLHVVRESLAELVMINAQMERIASSEKAGLDLDSVLLRLYTMLIQLQSARCAIETEQGRIETAHSADSSVSSVPTLPDGPRAMTYREYVEFTNLREYQKFVRMGPITDEEMRICDAEEILRKLA